MSDSTRIFGYEPRIGDQVNITIVGDKEYKKYVDLIMDIYAVTEEDIKCIEENENERKEDENNFLADTIKTCFNKYKNDFFLKLRCEVIVWSGNIASRFLGGRTIQACTMFEYGNIKCFITWKKDVQLLERVILHELCHANRLEWKSFTRQREYLEYIGDDLTRLCEEMLAISVEKMYFPDLEWQEIACVREHESFQYYEKEVPQKSIYKVSDITKLINSHDQELDQYIYFLAYYLSKKYRLNEKVLALLYLEPNDLLQNLLADTE